MKAVFSSIIAVACAAGVAHSRPTELPLCADFRYESCCLPQTGEWDITCQNITCYPAIVAETYAYIEYDNTVMWGWQAGTAACTWESDGCVLILPHCYMGQCAYDSEDEYEFGCQPCESPGTKNCGVA